MGWFRVFLCHAALLQAAWAQSALVPDTEAAYVPTPQRIAAIHAVAQRDGWAALSVELRVAATRAYEQDKLQAAEAWLNVFRWARLLGQPEAEFVPAWVGAVNEARVGHPGMSVPAAVPTTPLAAKVAPALQAWILGNAAFSAEFFALLTPVDYLPRVLEILDELHRRDPAQFKSFASLALAIAVVYDVPPPPVWPHGQVTPEALPRKLPEPAAAFAWWIKQERSGKLYHRVSKLGADELKFVVDASAPFTELEWAQGASPHALSNLAGAYSMIRYRNDRITQPTPVWPGRSYKLAEILAAGGICSDQAYFATQVGKARGVPTLFFYGPGNDGRHAWFGYLDGSQKWQLEAGRYAEQRFVTGYARDPQTWREFTDHELKFLSERFRELPAYRQSRVHASFAAEFLAEGKALAAATAARKAVNYERRNQAAWETLIAAARKDGKDAKTIEAVLREAALAFQRYPDLEAAYASRVAESLRARGETSAAENELRRIALKNKSDRGDLSVQQARDIVQRAVVTQPLAEQIQAFNAVVDRQARGAGVGFFDQVVVPFVVHLLEQRRKPEAMKALERARRALHVEPNSQLARDFERLAAIAKDGK